MLQYQSKNNVVNNSKSTRGRPYKYSNEEMFNCIVEVLKLGCSWSDISKHYSFHKDTVRKRFKQWTPAAPTLRRRRCRRLGVGRL